MTGRAAKGTAPGAYPPALPVRSPARPGPNGPQRPSVLPGNVHPPTRQPGPRTTRPGRTRNTAGPLRRCHPRPGRPTQEHKCPDPPCTARRRPGHRTTTKERNPMKTWTRDETKASLPPGTWQDEPDKAVWIDEATGLDCMIHRHHSGALCGYVGVGPDHPWHGLSYGGCTKGGCGEDWCEHGPASLVEVHGGLTYADACQQSDTEDHGICHVPQPGRPRDVWWFGFDCAHYRDVIPGHSQYIDPDPDAIYRPFDYVHSQVTRLAGQIAAATKAAER